MIPPKFVSSSTQIRAVRAETMAPAAATYASWSLRSRPQNRSRSTTIPAQPASTYSGASSDQSKFTAPPSAAPNQRTREPANQPSPCGLLVYWIAGSPSGSLAPWLPGSRSHPRDGAHVIGDAVDERRWPDPHEGDEYDEQ